MGYSRVEMDLSLKTFSMHLATQLLNAMAFISGFTLFYLFLYYA